MGKGYTLCWGRYNIFLVKYVLVGIIKRGGNDTFM